MKSTIRRRLAPILAVVIATVGMSLAASATAQASTITNVRNGDCLGIQFWQEGEQARTTRCNSSIFQRWSFVPVIGRDGDPGTYYKIVNGYTDMCLDVSGISTSNWAKVWQWTCLDADNQLWKRERTFRGTDMLRARHTDKCLDISWGAAIQFECNGSQNQEFTISLF